MADKNRPLHILKYLWDHTDLEIDVTFFFKTVVDISTSL